MQELVSIDGNLMPAAVARVEAASAAALYGRGVFTTVAIIDSQPFLWEKHWRRLQENSARTGMGLSKTAEARVRDALDELLRAKDILAGRARITVFDRSAAGLWPFALSRASSILIIASDKLKAPNDLHLTISAYSVNSASPLAGIKCCNYLENILALDTAQKSGFDEAIRTNELGQIVSACMANVFWTSNGRLFTPSLLTGCLPGTTREFVLENLECIETQSACAAPQKADAIFLTSAGLGTVRAESFEGRSLAGDDHPILRLIPGDR